MEILMLFSFVLIQGHAEYIYNIDDSVGLGRRFDGVGGLSGDGATSKLLVNYPEKERNEILDYLFKPNFGASLHILKVEIGGDAQSTEGTEASHMHYPWDLNFERGYEWWMMKEAKKRNPEIKLYGLPWGFPGWVGGGTQSPYTYPNITANYVCKWILGAKSVHNLTIDYVGIWNERPYDITYILTLRAVLDDNGLNHVEIVAADGDMDITHDILYNPDLRKAVSIIGKHQPHTDSSVYDLQTGKPLWASEDFSQKPDDYGGACWARTINQDYVNGFITGLSVEKGFSLSYGTITRAPRVHVKDSSTVKPIKQMEEHQIAWCVINSMYDGLPYFDNGLMRAVEPWGGHYYVAAPIWASAHTTQFTKPGWLYLKHGSGVGNFSRGGSYVTFISPDRKDFTIVIETGTFNHSHCRKVIPPFTVEPQGVTLKLAGSMSGVSSLSVWYTKLTFDGSDSTIFQQRTIQVVNDEISLKLDIDEIWTLTTITTGQKGQHPEPPAFKPFPLPYSDNFDVYPVYSEAYNLVQQSGIYEVTKVEGDHKMVIRQMSLEKPVAWQKSDLLGPTINIIGNYNWSDIIIAVDARPAPINGTSGLFVAARTVNRGLDTSANSGVYFFIFPENQTFVVAGNVVRKHTFKTGRSSAIKTDDWNRISLGVKGNQAYGLVNSEVVFNTTIPAHNHGFSGLGTTSYHLADFDNIYLNSL